MAQTKERQISTQSQLKLVLDWAQHCGYCLSLLDTVMISTVLVDYVENGYSKEIRDRVDKIDEYVKDKQNKISDTK